MFGNVVAVESVQHDQIVGFTPAHGALGERAGVLDVDAQALVVDEAEKPFGGIDHRHIDLNHI